MPKYTVTFRTHDHLNGPPVYGQLTPRDGDRIHTAEEALALCKSLYPYGSDFRVFEMKEVTIKPKYRYVVDIERDSSYDPHKKVKEALVYEAQSAEDAANMARDEFGPSWKVVDVSNITSMKNLLEGTDVLG